MSSDNDNCLDTLVQNVSSNRFYPWSIKGESTICRENVGYDVMLTLWDG